MSKYNSLGTYLKSRNNANTIADSLIADDNVIHQQIDDNCYCKIGFPLVVRDSATQRLSCAARPNSVDQAACYVYDYITDDYVYLDGWGGNADPRVTLDNHCVQCGPNATGYKDSRSAIQDIENNQSFLSPEPYCYCKRGFNKLIRDANGKPTCMPSNQKLCYIGMWAGGYTKLSTTIEPDANGDCSMCGQPIGSVQGTKPTYLLAIDPLETDHTEYTSHEFSRTDGTKCYCTYEFNKIVNNTCTQSLPGYEKSCYAYDPTSSNYSFMPGMCGDTTLCTVCGDNYRLSDYYNDPRSFPLTGANDSNSAFPRLSSKYFNTGRPDPGLTIKHEIRTNEFCTARYPRINGQYKCDTSVKNVEPGSCYNFDYTKKGAKFDTHFGTGIGVNSSGTPFKPVDIGMGITPKGGCGFANAVTAVTFAETLVPFTSGLFSTQDETINAISEYSILDPNIPEYVEIITGIKRLVLYQPEIQVILYRNADFTDLAAIIYQTMNLPPEARIINSIRIMSVYNAMYGIYPRLSAQFGINVKDTTSVYFFSGKNYTGKCIEYKIHANYIYRNFRDFKPNDEPIGYKSVLYPNNNPQLLILFNGDNCNNMAWRPVIFNPETYQSVAVHDPDNHAPERMWIRSGTKMPQWAVILISVASTLAAVVGALAGRRLVRWGNEKFTVLRERMYDANGQPVSFGVLYNRVRIATVMRVAARLRQIRMPWGAGARRFNHGREDPANNPLDRPLVARSPRSDVSLQSRASSVPHLDDVGNVIERGPVVGVGQNVLDLDEIAIRIGRQLQSPARSPASSVAANRAGDENNNLLGPRPADIPPYNPNPRLYFGERPASANYDPNASLSSGASSDSIQTQSAAFIEQQRGLARIEAQSSNIPANSSRPQLSVGADEYEARILAMIQRNRVLDTDAILANIQRGEYRYAGMDSSDVPSSSTAGFISTRENLDVGPIVTIPLRTDIGLYNSILLQPAVTGDGLWINSGIARIIASDANFVGDQYSYIIARHNAPDAHVFLLSQKSGIAFDTIVDYSIWQLCVLEHSTYSLDVTDSYGIDLEYSIDAAHGNIAYQLKTGVSRKPLFFLRRQIELCHAMLAFIDIYTHNSNRDDLREHYIWQLTNSNATLDRYEASYIKYIVRLGTSDTARSKYLHRDDIHTRGRNDLASRFAGMNAHIGESTYDAQIRIDRENAEWEERRPAERRADLMKTFADNNAMLASYIEQEDIPTMGRFTIEHRTDENAYDKVETKMRRDEEWYNKQYTETLWYGEIFTVSPHIDNTTDAHWKNTNMQSKYKISNMNNSGNHSEYYAGDYPTSDIKEYNTGYDAYTGKYTPHGSTELTTYAKTENFETQTHLNAPQYHKERLTNKQDVLDWISAHQNPQYTLFQLRHAFPEITIVDVFNLGVRHPELSMRNIITLFPTINIIEQASFYKIFMNIFTGVTEDDILKLYPTKLEFATTLIATDTTDVSTTANIEIYKGLTDSIELDDLPVAQWGYIVCNSIPDIDTYAHMLFGPLKSMSGFYYRDGA